MTEEHFLLQRSLATDLQNLSMEFRKKQSTYLKRLQQQKEVVWISISQNYDLILLSSGSLSVIILSGPGWCRLGDKDKWSSIYFWRRWLCWWGMVLLTIVLKGQFELLVIWLLRFIPSSMLVAWKQPMQRIELEGSWFPVLPHIFTFWLANW